MVNNFAASYGEHTPLALPIDQQHSAHQPGITHAEITPALTASAQTPAIEAPKEQPHA